jgi:hypothetical protein
MHGGSLRHSSAVCLRWRVLPLLLLQLASSLAPQWLFGGLYAAQQAMVRFVIPAAARQGGKQRPVPVAQQVVVQRHPAACLAACCREGKAVHVNYCCAVQCAVSTLYEPVDLVGRNKHLHLGAV